MKYKGFPAMYSYKNFFICNTVLKLKFCKVKDIPKADIFLKTFCVLIANQSKVKSNYVLNKPSFSVERYDSLFCENFRIE